MLHVIKRESFSLQKQLCPVYGELHIGVFSELIEQETLTKGRGERQLFQPCYCLCDNSLLSLNITQEEQLTVEHEQH